MNKKPPELMKAEIEGVSILKPLKGVDPNLEDNLETLFELDYPQVMIGFCMVHIRIGQCIRISCYCCCLT